MAQLRQHEIRRRADGSIDTGFYAARAGALRRAKIAETGRRFGALVARLKAALGMRGAGKAA
jgi:hypothetical protein